MTKKFQNFLSSATIDAFGNLLEEINKKLQKTMDVNSLSIMIAAAVQVAKSMNMEEELKLLGLIVTVRFAQYGLSVPENISRHFLSAPAVPPAPQAVSAKPAEVRLPTPVVHVSASPARKPVVPARQFKPFDPVNAKKTWLGQLGGAVNNSGKAPWGAIRGTAVRLFDSGMELMQSEWELLFAAIAKAKDAGDYIIGTEVVKATSFQNVPSELLDTYLFGNGGIVSIIAEIKDSKTEYISSRIVAGAHVALDLATLFHRNSENGLDDFQRSMIEKLKVALEAKKAHAALLEKVQSLLSKNHPVEASPKEVRKALGAKPEDFRNSPRIVGDLSSVLKGHKPETLGSPQEDANFERAMGVEPPPATEIGLTASVQ